MILFTILISRKKSEKNEIGLDDNCATSGKREMDLIMHSKFRGPASSIAESSSVGRERQSESESKS